MVLHKNPPSPRIPAHRQRPLLMQLALASGALAQPTLAKGERFTDDFWADGSGVRACSSMEKIVEGIRLYQSHPYERKPLRTSVVWADGETRLLWFAAHPKGRRSAAKGAILVIPSMINGAEILDILPDERSLLRSLAADGYDVFLLEWGNLRADEELRTLDKALGKKLVRAVDWLSANVQTPLYGMGYCMGGVFLAAAEILRPDAFAGLIFIATPWDFHAGAEGGFAEALTGWAKDGLKRVRHLDYMPNEGLQMIFAGVDPTQVARKFSAFSEVPQNGLEARLFVAVEDWVNGGGDLPAPIVREIVQSWYIENKIVAGEWSVGKTPIDARRIRKPSFVIIPSKDKIVSPASARALARQIKGATRLVPSCGHISMMVGARAEEQVWTPLKTWLKTL